MKKIFVCLACLIFSSLSANADEIDKLIKNFDLNKKSELSVFVKNIDTNKVLYKKQAHKLLNPASTLKVLTYGASLLVLGNEYDFQTSIYESGNDLYLKLSGDTKLSFKDLKNLLSNVKNKEYENIYIDNSIFANEKYPASWLEEDKFPNQREISPYIIDNNITKIGIKRSSLATNIDIIQEDEYKIAIINNLKNSQTGKQEIKIERLHGENAPILTLTGEISKDSVIDLPVLNPEINFMVKFQKALDDNKIICSKKIVNKSVPQDAIKIADISRNIQDFSKDILYRSDNFTSEVISKTAAAKYVNYSHGATFEDEIKMFNDVLNISNDKIQIADSSGVSRKNLITTEFYIDTIEMLFNKTQISNMLMGANQGTMSGRGLFLKDNLKAKTGTLKNYSSIFANLITINNNNLVLISIEQDATLRKALLKNFEDMLIGLLYKKY